MIAPMAPAAVTLLILSEKLQLPRSTSAIVPAIAPGGSFLDLQALFFLSIDASSISGSGPITGGKSMLHVWPCVDVIFCKSEETGAGVTTPTVGPTTWPFEDAATVIA